MRKSASEMCQMGYKRINGLSESPNQILNSLGKQLLAAGVHPFTKAADWRSHFEGGLDVWSSTVDAFRRNLI